MKACVVYGSDIVLHLEFSVFVRPGSPRSLHSGYGIARPDRQQHPLGSWNQRQRSTTCRGPSHPHGRASTS